MKTLRRFDKALSRIGLWIQDLAYLLICILYILGRWFVSFFHPYPKSPVRKKLTRLWPLTLMFTYFVAGMLFIALVRAPPFPLGLGRAMVGFFIVSLLPLAFLIEGLDFS